MNRLIGCLALLCLGTTASSSFVLLPSQHQKKHAVVSTTRKKSSPQFSRKVSSSSSSLITLHGGDSVGDAELQDFSGATSSLFGNIRIPAALFAGASAGAAFALPINMASEGLKVGLVKRVYSLLLVGALSSEILAVVVSTVAVASLATGSAPKSKTLSGFISANYALAWASARFHFLVGVLWFVMGLGLRAWVTIGCPIFARAALGLISSATLLCVAFIQDMGATEEGQESFNFLMLPFRYVQLFFQKAKGNPLFAAALVMYSITFGYVLYKAPHVWHYLATN
jgi:hypothetical protein